MTVHRASSDDVVGVVCEWKVAADVNSGKISNMQYSDLGCSAKREVPAAWNGKNPSDKFRCSIGKRSDDQWQCNNRAVGDQEKSP